MKDHAQKQLALSRRAVFPVVGRHSLSTFTLWIRAYWKRGLGASDHPVRGTVTYPPGGAMWEPRLCLQVLNPRQNGKPGRIPVSS